MDEGENKCYTMRDLICNGEIVMKNDQLDAIDKQIIEILEKDARTPVKDIAQAVFLTCLLYTSRCV